MDVLIPRGGAGLIRTVVENSTVPVIETGVGNCHVYVDEGADLGMAVEIVVNAKTQRPGVCNACETLLVHSAVAESFLPEAADVLGRREWSCVGTGERERSFPMPLSPPRTTGTRSTSTSCSLCGWSRASTTRLST